MKSHEPGNNGNMCTIAVFCFDQLGHYRGNNSHKVVEEVFIFQITVIRVKDERDGSLINTHLFYRLYTFHIKLEKILQSLKCYTVVLVNCIDEISCAPEYSQHFVLIKFCLLVIQGHCPALNM